MPKSKLACYGGWNGTQVKVLLKIGVLLISPLSDFLDLVVSNLLLLLILNHSCKLRVCLYALFLVLANVTSST